MRPFRELYMYLCVAQQEGGEGEHSPRTSFGTPIATNSTWKMRSRKVSAVALYDWDFGGTNVPLPFQHFRPFSFFSLPFYLYIFFFCLVTTQPGGLTLRTQSLWHCCCHWHAVDIITNKLCVKDTFQRHVDSDAMIGSFRPLKGGYCGLFDFKFPVRTWTTVLSSNSTEIKLEIASAEVRNKPWL